jgi:hypothetical protein
MKGKNHPIRFLFFTSLVNLLSFHLVSQCGFAPPNHLGNETDPTLPQIHPAQFHFFRRHLGHFLLKPKASVIHH